MDARLRNCLLAILLALSGTADLDAQLPAASPPTFPPHPLPTVAPVPRIRQGNLPEAERNVLRSMPPVPTSATKIPAIEHVEAVESTTGASAPANSATSAITKEDIGQRIELVRADKEIDEAVRTDLLTRLQKATDSLTQAEETAVRIAQFLVDIQQAPQLAEEVAAKLAVPAAEMTTQLPSVPPENDLPQLEQHLTVLQSKLAEATDEFNKWDTEFKRRTERKAELTKSLAEFTTRTDELRQQRAVPVPAGEKAVVTLVRQTELGIKELLLGRQMELAKIESQRIDARVKLVPLQRDLAKRQLSAAEKELAEWQRLLAERRKQDSLRQAEEARRQVHNADPALRQLAERNAALADKRRGMAASMEKVLEESRTLNKQLAELNSDFDRLRERINVAKMTRANGILLRKQRADLRNISIPYDRLRFIEDEMPTVQLELIELEEERSSLPDVDTLVAEVDAKLPESLSPEERQLIHNTAADLLAAKRELLYQTIDDHNAYIKGLSELEFSSRNLLDQTEKFTAFIDQHVLWIRSSEPLTHHDFKRAATGIANLIDARLWMLMGQRTVAGLWRKPLQGGFVLLLVLVLVVMRQRMWSRVQQLCVVDSGNSTLNFLPTLEALFLVILRSSVWPCLMWCAGWWLESGHNLDDFSGAIAAGLQRGALFLLLLQLVRNSTLPDGIGETHFGWYASGTSVVRDNLMWVGFVGIPIAIAVTVVGEMEDGQWNDSLGRLAFMGGMVVTATAMHNVFRLQKGMFHEALARDPQSWLNRVRFAGYVLGTGIPCALAVLAAAGYYFSARQLAIRFELTMLVALSLVLAHGVASRWFLVKRRNLAIKQARERRTTQADSTTDSKPIPIPTANLSKIQSQLQILLRYLVVLSVLIVAWFVWSDVLPALHILDRFVLWNSDHGTTTLMHGVLAVFFLIGTAVMGKNLPALLEITILERLPIDHGGRYAAGILFRYVLYVSGLLLVARTLNMSWSSVQWLAAAITVGLGFGLQEIFANLVSGLIILFERPIRVGDQVTVNGITGTVTRMQIRATTITDPDRRELIVPNKKFITEDVINWSLTDPISRITIAVGIAYNADTELAHSILQRVAAEHPLVLDDPPPVAVFKRFGDSTLDFALYVYIASRESFRIVLHDLHVAIEREFRLANIEIAYPQREVTIRSISPEALPTLLEAGKTKAA